MREGGVVQGTAAGRSRAAGAAPVQKNACALHPGGKKTESGGPERFKGGVVP